MVMRRSARAAGSGTFTGSRVRLRGKRRCTATQSTASDASDKGDGRILGWLAALVIATHPHHHLHHGKHHFPPQPRCSRPVCVTRRVFGARWGTAWCIAYYESRHRLAARNGVNLGPWQINTTAHPWTNGYLLTHSWRYSARVAYRISHHGTNWTPWTTHRLCGV